MTQLKPSICRVCNKACPIIAEVDEGRLVGVHGDRSNPLYAGYTCVKGRALPAFVNHPERLLRSYRRDASGELRPIALDDALDQIAALLVAIIDEHGPRAVATYTGTQFQNLPAMAVLRSLMQEIGSPMSFGAFTVDKPGRAIAWSMLGRWMAPPQGFQDPGAVIMIGINPFVNGLGGVPLGHPGHWLSTALAAGTELIVIDPRRTDVAKRATIHLQPAPGHDIALLAAMIRVVLAEGLEDRAFLAQHVRNVDELRHAVRRFDPAQVAGAAGVDVDQLVRAARAFATAGRGYVVPGTGPHMAGQGTLLEYLALCLDTICGHWLGEGEVVANPGVLGAPTIPRAQAEDPKPAYGFGEASRIRGPGMTVAGMPSATLAEEILLEGEGQVRALISCGGNPVAAFPDQLRTEAALRSLDLLVQIDPWLSQTAKLADYVIAPKMTPEMAGSTLKAEISSRSYATGYGFALPYAQYVDAAVEPPPGAEVVEDWEVFYGIAQRLGLQLRIVPESGPSVALDMAHPPTADALVELLSAGSRVPLEDVRHQPHGGLFPPDAPVVVAPSEPGWAGRLDVGNPDLMGDLGRWSAEPEHPDLPFRLVNRRMMHVVNSSYDTHPAGARGNPAFMHPEDLEALGLEPGDAVVLRSRRSSVPAVVQADIAVRPGVVSMSFGFGTGPEGDHLFRSIGSNVARLLDASDGPDPYSSQPRMSNVPVAVHPAGPTDVTRAGGSQPA